MVGRREPDIRPYQGLVQWDAVSRSWAIYVRSWRGVGLFYVNPDALFDTELLRAYLVQADLRPNNVTLLTERHECVVTLLGTGLDRRKQGQKLLQILRTHYGHCKGRPIAWEARLQ